VFDTVAGALREIENVRIKELPRMADFAEWATAAELALGWDAGSFMKSYTKNRAEADEVAIESSPIGPLICEIAENGFQGTATELLARLNAEASDELKKSKSWPRNEKKLGSHIKRLAPNLREAGYVVERAVPGRRFPVALGDVPTVPRQEGGQDGDGRDGDDVRHGQHSRRDGARGRE
jgi:putative DNA primase/helicase